jgi:hypothetical protein
MANQVRAVLTPEQWDARDYRQTAAEIDRWAKTAARPGADSTEYVSKLGLDENGCVIVMNRAHDRVLVPPPARAALAAFALADQPFGLTHVDVAALHAAVEASQDSGISGALRRLATRLQSLLPPSDA